MFNLLEELNIYETQYEFDYYYIFITIAGSNIPKIVSNRPNTSVSFLTANSHMDFSTNCVIMTQLT